MSPPRISVVIPAFNEERYLPRLLASIEAARALYAGGPGAVEVIVADNGSTDGTAAAAAACGCRVVPVARRAIAAARNGGARAATGEVLAFVDADTVRIHAGTFGAVAEMMGRERCAGGATGVTLERWSAGIAVFYVMLLPLVWLTGMDTGVVFCRREDFDAVGGYDESLLVAEDLAFLSALRRHGRRRGRRLMRARDFKAVASARKFDQHGDWHYLTLAPRLVWLYALRRRAALDLIRRYWYERGR